VILLAANIAEMIADIVFKKARISWKKPMFLSKLAAFVYLVCTRSLYLEYIIFENNIYNVYYSKFLLCTF